MTPRRPLFDNRLGVDYADCGPMARAAGLVQGTVPGGPPGDFRVPVTFFLEHDDFPDRLRGTAVGHGITHLQVGSDVHRVRGTLWAILTDNMWWIEK